MEARLKVALKDINASQRLEVEKRHVVVIAGLGSGHLGDSHSSCPSLQRLCATCLLSRE